MKVDFKNMNKWFYAFAGVALLLVGALVAIIILGVNAGKTPPPVEIPADGEESGIYYYDVAEGEILLSFNSGNKFTIAGPTLNKSGEYTVSDGNITLDFVRDEDGSATATMQDGKIVLSYNGTTMTFLEKINYTVSFDTDNGSTIGNVSVVNGKTAGKPQDPTKDGYVFLGWYQDADLKVPFDFVSYMVTKDTTVYARWAEKPLGYVEVNVDFALGDYDGAPSYDDMVTIGGKLYNVPTPTRDGYTFGGWFISMYEDGEKLTYAYDESVVLDADTTLYAVWYDNSATKLPAPAVSVTESVIKWNNVAGANGYKVVIKDASGNEVHTANVGSTSAAFDFGARVPGTYTVEVIATSGNAEKNSDPAIRYYNNKALDRVYNFQVVDGVLVFNTVAGAEKYLITVDCGNKDHNHTMFDNGNSTTFNFSNCSMQEGGIKFVVTAVANGYSSSVSETYVYNRTLAGIDSIVYDSANDTVVWNVVENATGYTVTVVVGDKTYVVNNGTKNSFSLANYSGDITVSVVPVTEGFNSPAAAVTTTTKTAPATPGNVSANGSIITWDAVAGADSYEIKVGTYTTTVNTNSFDASAVSGLEPGNSYDVQVKAIAGNAKSAYSAPVSVGYLVMDTNVTYKNNTLYWSPVLGVTEYEVRVNGANAFTVSGATSAKVVLTKAGINKVEVRYTQYGGSSWVGTEVYAYAVTYDTRTTDNGEFTEYVAVGDMLTLPSEIVKNGFDFDGWYNTPGAVAGNGKPVSSGIFNGNGDVVYYANWTPKTYKVEYQIDGFEITNIQNPTSDATFSKDYTLTVPVSSNPTYGDFIGWYTGPSGSGTQLTDANGNSVAAYPYWRDTIAYPFFNVGILTFNLKADGTYSVKRGPNFASVSNVTVPSTYNNIPVTSIEENAFASQRSLKTINIPSNIKLVGTGAFSGCTYLEAINMYQVDGNYETFYTTSDGALIRHDMGTVYLEIVPRAKTGSFVIPDEVDIVRNKAFQYSKLSTVVVSAGVSQISSQAFYSCTNLRTVEFEGGRTTDIVLEENIFYGTSNITTIKLPAMIATFDTALFDSLKNLTYIEVEEGGVNYGSVNGWLTNGMKDTVIYTPPVISGELTIPVGIRNIGNKAFFDRDAITSVVIPNFVNSIGSDAFANCDGITSVTFEGGRLADLSIGGSSFARLSKLASVKFEGNDGDTLDTGIITIGAGAFAPAAATAGEILKLKSVEFANGVNVESIGASAFAGQTALSGLVFADNIRIKEIANNAFENCSALTAIEIPASTEAIGSGAFKGCSYVSEVSFAEGSNEITFGTGAFENCARIVYVNLPSTARDFDGTVFAGCPALRYVTVDDNNPYLEDVDGVLFNEDKSALLFYPKALPRDSATVATLPWDTITKIGPLVFANATDLTSFTVKKNVTEIGEGAFSGCTKLSSLTFEGGGTALTIGNNAFYKCSALQTVSLPSYTTNIGNSAFESAGLKSFTIPASLKTIGDLAFKSTKIVTLTIPASLEFIGDGAFKSVTTLTSVTIQDGADLTIGTLNAATDNGAFYGCTKLTTIDFNNRVVSVGNYAFKSTSSSGGLKSVTLGNKLTTIGSFAFYRAPITSLYIPKNVTSIGGSAFGYTSNHALASLTFEMGGTEPLHIGNYAFQGTKLTEVTLPNRVTELWQDTHLSSGITIKRFLVFEASNSFAKLNIEDGSTLYKTIDGVLYGVDSNGVPTSLMYVPVANKGTNGTGELIVPNTVVFVENLTFAKISGLTTVTFEEFPTTDERYATQILEIGYGDATTAPTNEYPVFGNKDATGCTITTINFPSHLSSIGGYAIYNTPSVLTVNFNSAARNIKLYNYAFYYANSAALNLPGVAFIGNSAFSQSKMTEISLGVCDALEMIGPSAFASSKISSITIPASVVTIGANAFNGAEIKTVNFEAGSKIKNIEHQAFYNALSLESIDLTNATDLESIGYTAFYKTAITSFTFPNSVKYLGYNVFSECSALTTINLGSTFSAGMLHDNSYGYVYAFFGGCSSLEAINVDPMNPELMSEDGVLYDRAKTILFCFPANKDYTGYVIPESVVAIERYAFFEFDGETITIPANVGYIGEYAFKSSTIKSIVIPNEVAVIRRNAFADCYDLASVSISPESKLTFIGDYAFDNCTSLASIYLPDAISYIGLEAFDNCDLREIVLPAALGTINERAFSYNENLSKIVIQGNVTAIGAYAFAGSRITNIEIPATVGTISGYAFYRNEKLESVVFVEGSVLTVIGERAFDSCRSLETIEIPDTVTSCCTFTDCESLKYIKLPAGLEVINDNMFSGCASLETVILPENLKTIGAYAFSDTNSGKLGTYAPCVSLKSITIPASVTEIGDYAFNGCTALTEVIFEEGSQMTKLGSTEYTDHGIFKNTPALETVVLPANLTHIGGYVFENSGVKNVEFPATLTSIGNYAFSNCDRIESVDIFGNVTYLGDYSFFDCDNLVTANTTFGLEYFGGLAFGYCEKLTTAYIPATVNRLGANPYAGCSGVTSFTLDPDNQAYVMSDGILYDKTMYTILYYPASITTESVVLDEKVFEIAAGAFSGATMKEITIPARLGSIAANTFKNCTNLETVNIENGVNSIGANAFEGCVKLNNVSIPASCTDLGDYAFANCTSLSNFTFAEGTTYTIGMHFFEGCTSITEIILPESFQRSAADTLGGIQNNAKTKAIPSYMFANTGIVNAVLPETITSISSYGVFMDCKQLESITFLGTLKYGSIGSYYFAGCTKITEINIPNGGSDPINQSTHIFAGCTSLVTVTIDSSPSFFAQMASSSSVFEGCTSLKNVNYKAKGVPTALKYVGPSFFEGCTSLETITLADTVVICDSAFKNCTSLSNIIFEGTVTLKGNNSLADSSGAGNQFANCTSLKTLTFTGVATCMGNAFAGFTSEQTIVFAAQDAAAIIAMADEQGIFVGCEAKVFDCNGSQLIIDSATGKVIDTLPPATA